MAYDEFLADRIRRQLKDKGVFSEEKKMMGGLCFMVNDKMCLGVVNQMLMARVGPDNYLSALKRNGCREMDFTGRPMKGFVFVDPEGVDSDADLEYFVKLSLQYNPLAKSSKKKKRD